MIFQKTQSFSGRRHEISIETNATYRIRGEREEVKEVGRVGDRERERKKSTMALSLTINWNVSKKKINQIKGGKHQSTSNRNKDQTNKK